MSRISNRTLAVVLATAASAVAAHAPSTSLAAQPLELAGAWSGHATATPTANPAVFKTTDDGPGVATHIGAFWLSARETENFLTGTISDGAFTWTTTRGDTISGTYGGSFAPISPTSVKFRSPGWITGGTGRYRGATGTVVFAGVANSATFRVLGAFTATLSPGD